MVPKGIPSPSNSVTNPMRQQQETELPSKVGRNDSSQREDLGNAETAKESDEDDVGDENEEDGSGSELDLVI